MVVAFGETVWTGKIDASKLSLAAADSLPAVQAEANVVTALGSVVLDDEHVVTIETPASGIVKQVSGFEGDTVRAGSVLAVIQPHDRSVNNYELLSPIDGTIVERALELTGEVGSELLAFKIANLDHLKVELGVPPSAAGRVRIGDRVELRPLSAHELSLEGSVAALGNTREQPRVSVRVLDMQHHLRAGDPVRARIFAGTPSSSATSL